MHQLALFIHWVAHGYELRAEASLFGVSGLLSIHLIDRSDVLAEGTVQVWTDRSIQAITRHLHMYIHWPSLDKRFDLKARIKSIHGIPHCCGFIDGCHINLEQAPARPGKIAGAFHSQKERYGFNIVAAVDNKKRFIYLH